MEVQSLNVVVLEWGFWMDQLSLRSVESGVGVESRATALSLHSFFFFMGQTVGPLAYGLGLQHGGKVPTLLVSAAIMVILGLVCARLLKQRAPSDARA